MEKVWTYCRREEKEDVLDELKNVKAELLAFVKSHNMEPIGSMEVVGPGSAITRDSLKELLAQAGAGAYNVLLVDCFNSICTNGRQAIQYCDQLSHLGVKVISLHEQVELSRTK